MDRMSKDEVISICMEIIGFSGEGRALVYSALDFFLKNDYENAMDTIIKAEELILKALEIQFQKLVVSESRGLEVPFSIILSHAMDQVMITTTEKDLVKTLIKSKI